MTLPYHNRRTSYQAEDNAIHIDYYQLCLIIVMMIMMIMMMIMMMMMMMMTVPSVN